MKKLLTIHLFILLSHTNIINSESLPYRLGQGVRAARENPSRTFFRIPGYYLAGAVAGGFFGAVFGGLAGGIGTGIATFNTTDRSVAAGLTLAGATAGACLGVPVGVIASPIAVYNREAIQRRGSQAINTTREAVANFRRGYSGRQ